MGVRLLDRSPQGIEATPYGRALLRRSIAVFDELKQSVKDIEHLADPTTGEIRIACPLAIAFTVVPHLLNGSSRNIRVWSCTSTKCLPLLRRVIFGSCVIENMTSSWDGDCPQRPKGRQRMT